MILIKNTVQNQENAILHCKLTDDLLDFDKKTVQKLENAILHCKIGDNLLDFGKKNSAKARKYYFAL